MHDPTPVTTSPISTDSESVSTPKRMSSGPATIHENSCTLRNASWLPKVSTASAMLQPSATNMPPSESAMDAAFERRVNRVISTAERSGANTVT